MIENVNVFKKNCQHSLWTVCAEFYWYSDPYLCNLIYVSCEKKSLCLACLMTSIFSKIVTCFIYPLDSSLSSSFKFWSSKFPSSSICSQKSSSNDIWNDWMLSFEIAFHCTSKEIGAKAAFLFWLTDLFKFFWNTVKCYLKW